MQLYAGLPVLTNQPAARDLDEVPHHLVGIWPLDADGDVARYGELARAAVDGVLARGRLPIVCGGSGLYLRAALAELALPPRPVPGLRERLQADYDRDGAETAYRRLVAADAAAAARVHPNDRRRVVRALELHELGSSLAPDRDTLWAGALRYPTLIVGVQVPRAELRRRIAARTAAMFAQGVEAEVAAAVAACRPSATAARALGLDLLLARDPDAAGRLTTRTCAYARRQETWMRRISGLVPIDGAQPPDDAARAILGLLAAA